MYQVLKQTMKKCFKILMIYMALLQICQTLLGPSLQSLAALVFNRPVRVLPPSSVDQKCYLAMMKITMLPLPRGSLTQM